ncbi:hypothetical protein B0O80DRAFT_505824 [Mortierella sp. GBAus27b]|nr:hypothetical protein BGX31_002768 [Mortierella sp. GBA43]KAI8363589.1 hypothetical protein B0O80DRAFT_505824 [Mortierella sp. GBAus27b]
MLFKSSFVAAAVASLAVLSLTPTTEAHVGLRLPCPRGSNNRSKECELVGGLKAVDWNTPSPIANSKQVLVNSLKPGWKKAGLCKHTSKDKFVKKRPVIQAGKTLKTEYETNDPHLGRDAKNKGGHCQWALSYDKGKTFVVFQTKLTNCFAGSKKNSRWWINVNIPKNTPPGDAIFLWTYYNEIGNRELYTACSDVKIKSSYTGRKFSGLEPFIANFGPKSQFGAVTLAHGDGLYAKSVYDHFKNRRKITITAPKA